MKKKNLSIEKVKISIPTHSLYKLTDSDKILEMNKKYIVVKDRTDLGNAMRDEREKQKFTQAQVAKMAGLAPNYYSMIERGEKNVAFALIINILKVLKLEVVLSGAVN